MFVVSFLHSPLELLGLKNYFYFYPAITTHPDDPITLPFVVITYGIFIGQILGIILSLIYSKLKHEK